MAYRDENETLRARIATLEGDLDEANDRLARITGETVVTEKASKSYSRFLGAETSIDRKRVFDFEVSDEGFERLASVWRTRFEGVPAAVGAISVSQVGRTLTLKAPEVEAKVTARDGQTVVELAGELRSRSALLGFLTGTLSILPLGAFAALAKQVGLSPAHLVWALPLAVLVTFGLFRTLLRGGAITSRKRMGGAFEALADVVQQETAAREKLRIAEAVQAEQEALAEEEAGLADEQLSAADAQR